MDRRKPHMVHTAYAHNKRYGFGRFLLDAFHDCDHRRLLDHLDLRKGDA